MNRLLANGCQVKVLDQHLVVHLYHMKGMQGRGFTLEEYRSKTAHNEKLLEERKGLIVRNEGRNWGTIDAEV